MVYWGTHHDNSLIVNVPPDRTGRIREHEAERIIALADRLGIRGGGPLPTGPVNVIFGATATASSQQSDAAGAAKAVDTSLESVWMAGDLRPALDAVLPPPTPVDQIVIHEAPESRDAGDGFTMLHTFHVTSFEVGLRVNGRWVTAHKGGTIGAARRTDLARPETADGVRLRITQSDAPPRIAHLASGLRATRGLRPLYRVQ